MATRTFTTLPNGLVRVSLKFANGYECIRHYGNFGRVVYVITDYDDNEKYNEVLLNDVLLVNRDEPYLMREYETLEQAIRRMFSNQSHGLILTYVIIPMLVVAILAIIADPFNILR